MRIFHKVLILPVFLLLYQTVGLAGDWTIKLNPATVGQGKCFTVRVISAEGAAKIEAQFLSQKIKLFRNGNIFSAIIGVQPDQKPGSFPLIVTVDGKEILRNVTVKKTKYPVASFWLKPAKHKLLTSRDLINDEWGRIERELGVGSSEKKWEGKFQLPVKAPISMRFGTVERVNGKPRGQHRGMDLAASMETGVMAANNGKVVFAEDLQAFGGTMVIDYGQGIHSLYFHLSKFLVPVGEEVTKGQIVALSGNSGISSGPHLHWGMSAHDVRVDPLQWTTEEL